MPLYESYKPSGLDWIGDIPSGWNLLRAKYVFREVDDRSVSGDEELLSVSHLTGVTPRSEKNVTMFMAEDYTGAKLCRTEDLVINTMWAWMGALGVSPTTGIVSPAYGVYRQTGDHLHPKYVDWLLRTPNYVAEYTRRSTGVNSSRLRLYPDRFLDMPIIIPPIEDQGRIVAFLEQKAAEIDAAIEKKERLIELLNEQKSILLNQAVTIGVDPNSPMRESQLAWVGKIPCHWQVLPLKRLVVTKITDGPHETPKFVDCGIPFVSVEAAYDGKIDLEKRRGYISEKDHHRYCQKLKPQMGDIFIVKSGSTTGKTVMVDFEDEFSVWSPLALVRPNLNLANPNFLFLALQSTYFQRQVQAGWSQGTQPNIGMGDLEKLLVVCPPVPEQIAAIEPFLPKIQKIEEAISYAIKEISVMAEWKKTLVASVVTGRIKV